MLSKLRQRFARWLLRGAHLEDAHFGERSITMSPAGVGDVIRWSGTKTAVAAGDLGMDAATGVPQAFIGGTDVNLGVIGIVDAPDQNVVLGPSLNQRVAIRGMTQNRTVTLPPSPFPGSQVGVGTDSTLLNFTVTLLTSDGSTIDGSSSYVMNSAIGGVNGFATIILTYYSAALGWRIE